MVIRRNKNNTDSNLANYELPIKEIILPLQTEKHVLIYPLLDLTVPHIPQRSRLYPVSPVGIGTPYAESLTSYISRLAIIHNNSFGSFYELLLVPSLSKAYLTTPSHLSPASTLNGSFRNRMKNINGIGRVAREWSEMLEELTQRNDLHSISLIALSNVMPHWELLRTFQAWCPMCYEEMLQANQTIYQPLIWTMKAVNICVRHHRPLVDRCSHCHRQLLPLARRIQIGYCSRCGYWLGEHPGEGNTADSLAEEERDWRLFVASSTGDLIAALSNISQYPTKKAVVAALHECIKISTGGVITQFAKLIRKHLMTVYGWYRGNVRIPLSDLLRICYCLDLSITTLLSGAEAVRKSAITIKELPSIANVVNSPRTPKPFNHERVEKDLINIFGLVPPISMAEAARRIGVDRKNIYRIFPELSRKISERYRDYLQGFYRTERTRREDEVRNAVIHLHRKAVYVTPRAIAEYLNKPSYFGRRDVAIIIRETRESLDSEKKGWLVTI